MWDDRTLTFAVVIQVDDVLQWVGDAGKLVVAVLRVSQVDTDGIGGAGQCGDLRDVADAVVFVAGGAATSTSCWACAI